MVEGGGDLSEKNQFTSLERCSPSSCPSFVFVERALIGLVATLFEFEQRENMKYHNVLGQRMSFESSHVEKLLLYYLDVNRKFVA